MPPPPDRLAASLPEPPLPAPARRQAAIEEALRRFDGGAPRPAAADPRAPSEAGMPWWRAPARSWVPAFATAVLALLIALPVAWTVMRGPAGESGGTDQPPAAAEAPASDTAMARADPQPPSGAARSAGADESAATPPESARSAPDQAADRAPPGFAAEPEPAAEPPRAAAAPPPPPPARANAKAAREERGDDRLAEAGSSSVVVTGSRIAQPNLSAASPVTSVSEEDSIILTGTRTKAAGRGDWNACTVEDPNRSLSGCRALVDTKARGAAGKSAAILSQGLSSAWQGDHGEAIAAFDRAIAEAPGSAFAYLNRGLAWRREGDLDRALADLDRAVRLAPRTARNYYHRARILRERGDERRARADERRAVNLDPDYRAVVPQGSR